MKNWSHLKESVSVLIIIGVMIGISGCYTMLRHPTVAQEELVSGSDQELTGASCTDCHNNEYDHYRMSPHYWGFGSWGIRTYPYGYYGGYVGWQRYYYDPWWWGWNYYDPYPYYPYYPPGGGGGGLGTVSAPSPDRPMTRRGLNENMLPQSPPIPNPPTQPPVYVNPSPPANPSGGQSGSQPQIAPAPTPPPPPQNDNSNNDGRDGRRGGRG